MGNEPVWIVNDLGELGVQVQGKCYFLYKGGSLVYSGLHDDGSPMKYRIVGKREFGETCRPVAYVNSRFPDGDRYNVELAYHPGLSFGEKEDGDWKDMPVLECVG